MAAGFQVKKYIYHAKHDRRIRAFYRAEIYFSFLSIAAPGGVVKFCSRRLEATNRAENIFYSLDNCNIFRYLTVICRIQSNGAVM